MGRILVVGAQGNVGSKLVPMLLAAGEQILAATSKVASPAGTVGAEAVQLDLANPSTFAPALAAVDRAYIVAPARGMRAVDNLRRLVDAARAREVKVVLQSAMSAAAPADGAGLAEVERHLQEAGGRWAVLRPNAFMDNFHTLWAGPIRERGVVAVPAGDHACSLIDVHDVARAACAALLGAAFEGRTWTLAGPVAWTFAAAAQRLGQAAGRPLRYQAIADREYIAELERSGIDGASARRLAVLFAPVARGEAATTTADLQQVTGRAGRALEDYAHQWGRSWAAR